MINLANLIKGWKEDQTFLKILGPTRNFLYGQVQGCRVSLLVGKAQLAGCLKVWLVVCCGMQVSSDNAQSVIQKTVYKASVRGATPDWCAVLSC